jgi:sortase (surface protein transpeptidase)
MSEVVIYHNYNSSFEPLPPQSSGLVKLAKIFAVIGSGLLLFAYAPSFWYWGVNGLKTSIESFQLSNNEIKSLTTTYQAPVEYQPRFDPTLPLESHLTILSIGVDTVLQEATHSNYEEALKKGVWRVSDFGTPTDSSRPMILAAHRFGYLAWSNSFRRKSSFFNLPKLQVGDTVEITWRQRKYIYEIYSEGTGEEIADYSADLILYTCETLNGPIRIFKYARLLEV